MDISALQKRVYQILEPGKRGDGTSFWVGVFIVVVIIASVLSMILASVQALNEQYYLFFRGFGLFSMVVFTVEYLMRLWSCTADSRYARPFRGRIRWAMTPFAVIDLFAVLPFYMFIFMGVNITGLVILRIFRLLKVVRYSESINLILKVLKNERNTLATAYVVLFIVLVTAATLMFQVENPAQPDKFSSIPAALWWGIITLATIGYGDIVPITIPGKILGGIIALIGIGIFALPAGIMASGFTKILQKSVHEKKNRPRDGEEAAGGEDERYLCPHCREEIRSSELWRRNA